MTIVVGVQTFQCMAFAADSKSDGGSVVFSGAEKIYLVREDIPFMVASCGAGMMQRMPWNAHMRRFAAGYRGMTGITPSTLLADLVTFLNGVVANPAATEKEIDIPNEFLVGLYDGGRFEMHVLGRAMGSRSFIPPTRVVPPLPNPGSPDVPLPGAYWMGSTEALERLYPVREDGERTVTVLPTLPQQDAVDLARFMVETTIGYYRFKIDMHRTPVFGPVDIAVIDPYGAHWVSRKPAHAPLPA